MLLTIRPQFKTRSAAPAFPYCNIHFLRFSDLILRSAVAARSLVAQSHTATGSMAAVEIQAMRKIRGRGEGLFGYQGAAGLAWKVIVRQDLVGAVGVDIVDVSVRPRGDVQRLG